MKKLYQDNEIKITLVENYNVILEKDDKTITINLKDSKKSYELVKESKIDIADMTSLSNFKNTMNLYYDVDFIETYKNQNTLLKLKNEEGVTSINLNGFNENIDYVISLRLNDDDLKVEDFDLETNKFNFYTTY